MDFRFERAVKSDRNLPETVENAGKPGQVEQWKVGSRRHRQEALPPVAETMITDQSPLVDFYRLS
jgi:hypothetical protein